MKTVERWLERAEQAERLGDHEDALEAAYRAHESATEADEQFRALLLQARVESRGLDAPSVALETYGRAKELSRGQRLDRAAEAELGAGLCLLDLERRPEARETLRRAATAFRRVGDTLRRGCAELLLAEEAALSGDEHLAELHVEVAHDLLLAAGEPRLLATALTLHSELALNDDREEEARELLNRARAMAGDVADEKARTDLCARRREIVRTWLTAGADL
jgi:tetratricopeptide (TPR) repeat protein